MAIGSDIVIASGFDYYDGATPISSSGYVLIEEYTVSGSAITSYTFTYNLADYYYWDLRCSLYNPTGGSVLYKIQFNGDSTEGNYYQVYHNCNYAGTIAKGGDNTSNFLQLATGVYAKSAFTNIMRDVDGKVRYMNMNVENVTTNLAQTLQARLYNVNTAITSISVVADTASGIGIGSTFSLFGMRK